VTLESLIAHHRRCHQFSRSDAHRKWNGVARAFCSQVLVQQPHLNTSSPSSAVLAKRPLSGAQGHAPIARVLLVALLRDFI
jgi:hypothetical protein